MSQAETIRTRIRRLSREQRQRLQRELLEREPTHNGSARNGSDKQLCAYVIPKAGRVDPRELRGFLETKLPSHMLPVAFVPLNEFPRTPNGKIDRNNLPAPEQHREEAGDEVTPRSAVEEGLTAIWQEVLRIERIGIHENFFELGGHSLAAIQIVSRVREAFQVELPIPALFRSPTVAALAHEVEACSPQTEHQHRHTIPKSAGGLNGAPNRDADLPLDERAEQAIAVVLTSRINSERKLVLS